MNCKNCGASAWHRRDFIAECQYCGTICDTHRTSFDDAFDQRYQKVACQTNIAGDVRDAIFSGSFAKPIIIGREKLSTNPEE